MREHKGLIVGLAAGLLCVICIYLYSLDLQSSFEKERKETLGRFGGEQVEVLVATKDILPGERPNSSNCEMKLWVSELVPGGACMTLDELPSDAVTSEIFEGEIITKGRFEKSQDASIQVPEGLCAVSVPSKSVLAVGGSIRAGMRVDVYSSSGAATDLIASSVVVLSTSAMQGEKEGEEVTWVTLAVMPDLVKEIIAAVQKSEVYFSLPSAEALQAEDVRDSSGDEEGLDGAVEGESEAGEEFRDTADEGLEESTESSVNDVAAEDIDSDQVVLDGDGSIDEVA